nr:SsgA family sporulation/cell division regulator [Actinomycetota bacterium]
MTTRPTSVSAHLQLRLLVPGTAALPVRADLRYDVSDPYAVQISFHTSSQSRGDVVQWTFARQLL